MSSEEPQEVRDARTLLTDYFGEPVMPVSQYCDAFSLWATAIQTLNAGSGKGQGASYHDMLDRIEIDIRKSNLLYRLIYRGQQFRRRPCPVHKGHWSGLPLEPPACGCDLVGWLPEPGDPVGQPSPHSTVRAAGREVTHVRRKPGPEA
jgi:hypothetical protein